MATDNLASLSAAREAKAKRSGGNPPVKTGGKPTVQLVEGELAKVVDEAEAVLVAGDPGLYQYGSSVVSVVWQRLRASDGGDTYSMRLSALGVAAVLDRFSRCATFQRWSERLGCSVDCDPPKTLAEVYLSRDGAWKLPVILGVVTAPTLRPDGTVLETPGYDEATGILYDPRGVEFPTVPETPTREDGRRALGVLEELISEFALVTDVDRAVALSAILTTVVRRSLAVAPLHAFTAPEAGSGKSLLVDVAAAIATGERAAVTSTGKTRYGDEELEKRLVSSMLAADAVISLDNLKHPLGGAFLCQLLTQHHVKLRPLGRSVNVVVPNTSMFFATGNNLEVEGDANRRVLQARIDSGLERPELRVFASDPLERVATERGRYAVAALTAIRAHQAAGAPRERPPLGSYEGWCRLVRDALVWLGRADPVDAIEEHRRDDPERAAMFRIMEAWSQVFGTADPVLVREMVAAAAAVGDMGPEEMMDGDAGLKNPDLHEALAAVAKGERGGIDANRLALWLKRNCGRVARLEGVGTVRIDKVGVSHGAARWQLVRAEDRP